MKFPRVRRPIALLLGILLLASLFLFWPEGQRDMPPLPPSRAFSWSKDDVWAALEKRFREHARCPADAESRLVGLRVNLEKQLQRRAEADDAGWGRLETAFFDAASRLGTCHEHVQALMEVREDLRRGVKSLSVSWPRNDESHDRLYRLLYGTRAAVEELLLQAKGRLPALSIKRPDPNEPVAKVGPSAKIHGVRVFSGDILLSRGGAPTSAFIARGNDHPGNFSHAALVHVEDRTSKVSILEAHIERGVGVSSVDDYLRDKKLRILLLRLHPDHPRRKQEPRVAHRAAERAIEEIRARHIPYDFSMDFEDSSRQFCSEVVSSNYSAEGVSLWTFHSTFARPGLARWMHALGVENFSTHGPSDLEYDPQLQVVAEWFDLEALREAHVENAVIDVMLEEADRGAIFDYAIGWLPLVRLAKGYSVALNQLDFVGPVPEGMSATVALRAEWLRATHERRSAALERLAQSFQQERGYYPPYWRLVALARATH